MNRKILFSLLLLILTLSTSNQAYSQTPVPCATCFEKSSPEISKEKSKDSEFKTETHTETNTSEPERDKPQESQIPQKQRNSYMDRVWRDLIFFGAAISALFTVVTINNALSAN